MACDRGDFAEYAALRRELSDLEGDLSRRRAVARRTEAARSLEVLRRGDIIRVPGGRRSGMAVVLEPGPGPHRAPDRDGRGDRDGRDQRGGRGDRGGSDGRGGRGGRGPAPRGRGGPNLAPPANGFAGETSRMAAMAGHGPLVLTANRQVKRLSLADFPVPVEAVDRIRIPASFSVRSPQHRRDLAATVRNRLADRDIGGPQRAADWDDDRAPERRRSATSVRASDASGPRDAPGQEIAALRRRLRQHPSHGCPDREEHARYAERYTRLNRETEALERKVASRSHVIARTFNRVCAVLENLGYLTGDTVTPEGRLLGGLYTELDLLAAECLRRGYWDGLDTQELDGVRVGAVLRIPPER